MIEVGEVYYYVLDDVFILRVISVDEFVNFVYLSPDVLVDKGEINTWNREDFALLHKPLTKLHKLLKGIE